MCLFFESAFSSEFMLLALLMRYGAWSCGTYPKLTYKAGYKTGEGGICSIN
ncbi:hypothetical protein XCR1_1160027 [Xenorhabdus cabanillasii JM26]|uniref:Uncharacterized protein n=1 Tax=Xenorhabdus cabanillasii JM26 TaxID=1427517 RepID=W1IM57_9GAMM|nr:hypothetical protein XCR1_1160027 [Xenorhabdus cabanillasii JM26]